MLFQGEWRQVPANVLETIKSKLNSCIPKLQSTQFRHIKYRCKYILNNIDEPWGDSTLSSIINGIDDIDTDIDIKIEPEQLQRGRYICSLMFAVCRVYTKVNGERKPHYFIQDAVVNAVFPLPLSIEIEYFESERGCMIVMRVQKLVESKCDQLAFKLCRHAIHAIRLCTNAHPLRHTVSVRQHQSLLETYLSLLFKLKRLDDINTELDSMDAESAAEYIENSFISIEKTETIIAKKKAICNSYGNVASMSDNNSSHLYVNRLHKYHVRISQYALQYLLVNTLRADHSDENSAMIRRLLRLWMDQHRTQLNFNDLFSKLVLNSKTKFQIYFCCETLYETVSF